MPNNRSFPPGWNRVEPPIGEVVEGTRFIAFKVPIERRVEWNLRTVKRNRPEIKCIIDVTNTFKYYSSNDCERAGMHHFKIFGVPGQGAVPPEDKVQRFFDAVDEAEMLCENEGDLIGVSSTNGVSRIGYLMARYLIQRLGFEPDEAIMAVDDARGIEQEHTTCLNHLRQRRWEN